jgi:site-specific DNA-methyltransferase (adenine-specific)
MLPENFINQLLCCSCVDGMKNLPADSVSCTITSPPYDDIRTYGQHPLDFKAIATELYRITTVGGIVAWNVQDQIKGGDQTCTSFQQALFFKELGFRLHQTHVIAKNGSRCPSNGRYGTSPDFVFVFSKGKPDSINLIKDHRNKCGGKKGIFYNRTKNGAFTPPVTKTIPMWRVRSLIWEYNVGFNQTTKDRDAFKHPALMSERLAEDLITSYSRPGDLVFDPFMGAATTPKMAFLNNRQFLGMEIHHPYYTLAVQRMQKAEAEQRRRLDEFFGVHTGPQASPVFEHEIIEVGNTTGKKAV